MSLNSCLCKAAYALGGTVWYSTSYMKAAVYTKYGPPEVLQVKETDKPPYKNNEILVQVYASSVNRTDSGFLRAKPAVVRLFSGLSKPKRTILGCEYAGKVVAVGADVTKYKLGDKVFGFNDAKFGGHGQFAVFADTDPMAIMPKSASYEQMAAATEGAHYALSYIRAFGAHKGQKVLVNGATGAIGSAGMQLLKQMGVYVVATSTTKNVDLIKSLGPDKVIDWQTTDFTKCGELFDVVFDSVGKSSFKACKPLLKPGGVYVSSELGPWGQNPLLGIVSPLYKLFGAKRVMFPLPKNTVEIIEYLRDRVADGSFVPVIDKTYPLTSIVDAYTYVESGNKTGAVVIQVQ
jgi:NADPH:quinone reductase-like Zn-dependent oxidoreductase